MAFPEGVFSSLNLDSCVLSKEKKATSDPEIRADAKMSKTKAIPLIIT